MERLDLTEAAREVVALSLSRLKANGAILREDVQRGPSRGLGQPRATEFGYVVRAFSSAEAFLASDSVAETRCLILDFAMPGMSGPELQRELKRRRHEVPIAYITAHIDEAVRSQLLEMNAVGCLFKPFSDTDLLKALDAAFA